MEKILTLYMVNIYRLYQWYYDNRKLITIGNINLCKSIITKGVELCLS